METISGFSNNESVLPLDMFPEFDHKMERYYREVLNKKWPPQIIISLSGGKDSTALLLKHLENEIPIHKVFWFDTGWEFPQMYDHLDKLERYTGMKIERLQSPKKFDDLIKKYRWPSAGRRWCTSEKTAAAKRFIKTLDPDYVYLDTIGFAIGEENRTLKKTVYERWTFFPLIDYWRMTEPECLGFCKGHGFDWGGLYELMDRVSCFCCPLSKKSEVRAVKNHFPELWNRMVEMEKSMDRSEYIPWFKGKCGVEAYGDKLEYDQSLLTMCG
ncbi:MAG: phosphoadenosine phosphosulfate reductase family protein [Proteobacteria bacterium]|nr:phosphoadenosine phosphosulfate reductase family protein [Pseudomonadota bacterium]